MLQRCCFGLLDPAVAADMNMFNKHALLRV
jgi:hypothetical protein